LQILALDVETTGKNTVKDRIVEIGGVIYDHFSGDVLGELETLINPLRNIALDSKKKHGLTADHVSGAPTFEEFGPWLASLLVGRCVVAHNEGFDRQIIQREFERIGHELNFEPWVCTYKLTGLSLAAACEAYDISLEDHHSALADARTCLKILKRVDPRDWQERAVKGEPLGNDVIPPATLTRKQVGLNTDRKPIRPFSRRVEFQNLDAEFTYMALLNEFLEDMNLTEVEIFELHGLAADLGINVAREKELRMNYLDAIQVSCMRDGIVSVREAQTLNDFAKALGINARFVPKNESPGLPPKGALICVTGTADIAGLSWDKKRWKAKLEEEGYLFTDNLDKSDGVALLLQESEGSMSNKVKKAMSWGIPRMTFESFLGKLGGD
jgi:DNA polymerase-3 subunit epsilon